MRRKLSGLLHDYSVWAAIAFAVLMPGPAAVQAAVAVPDKPETPFKLATFEAQGKVRVGMVMGNRVLDLAGANAYLVKQAGVPAMKIPGGMRELIEQSGTVSKRLYQIANYLKDKKLDGLAFSYDLSKVSIKAPIKYPYNLLCMAANYWSHAKEMGVKAKVDPDNDDAFVFAKSPRSCITDPGAPFLIPAGRDKIDWEGELAVILGQPAFRVSRQKALDYVYGYSIMYDVSDRGGGKRGDPMFKGPDWFSGKSREGAAPFGPFIVPKEFMSNPHDLHIVTKVNGRVVQDGNTSDMIYDVQHTIAYITSIMTLYPGDVISTGTMAGVGAARKPPEFLKPGDVVEIEIEGIGTLRTPMQAAPSMPASP
ncbi:MAG: fumarylacetoacetate hydrolase family protein [Acidobacteria bacterium]|nr:fumarylacetoacetate hydrolase family protein [Acidobacteriota bacterium]